METVVTRFPPSPTGFLHLGGARTALFNWLFARHHGGRFVLRIEDTDVERNSEEATQGILDAMEWLGLDYDEGPHYQTKRLDIYQEYIDKLLASGNAYYCECTPEELEAHRQKAIAEGGKPKYNGKCRDRNLGPGPNRVVRLRAPLTGETNFMDLVKGPITFRNDELDDLILQRGNGMFTYNFVVVVDDITMGMTHIIRGDDHVNNTPRQILIYQALGVPVPKFAHIPMILGSDRAKLSKRHGATSVMAYRDTGYLPQAMVNYLARLGWAHGDQEIFSREELIEHFSLGNVGRAACVFDHEKLKWLNQHYIKESTPAELIPELIPMFAKRGYLDRPEDYVAKAVATLQERVKTLDEMADAMNFYMLDDVEYDPQAAAKFLKPAMVEPFKRVITVFEEMEVFDEKALEEALAAVLAELGVKLGKLAQPMRVSLTGRAASPGLFEIIDIMGKETVLRRLRKALEFMQQRAAEGERS